MVRGRRAFVLYFLQKNIVARVNSLQLQQWALGCVIKTERVTISEMEWACWERTGKWADRKERGRTKERRAPDRVPQWLTALTQCVQLSPHIQTFITQLYSGCHTGNFMLPLLLSTTFLESFSWGVGLSLWHLFIPLLSQHHLMFRPIFTWTA